MRVVNAPREINLVRPQIISALNNSPLNTGSIPQKRGTQTPVFALSYFLVMLGTCLIVTMSGFRRSIACEV
ncbi:MAG: hypothetical protein ACI9ES_001067 [Oceanospirillaceae bacterium]|jgi:hypothetical protein